MATPLFHPSTMEANHKEQVKPLAHPSPSVSPLSPTDDDEEAAVRWRSSQYLRRRQWALCCCGCCSSVIIILGFTILILALTTLKVKDPVLIMNAVQVDAVNFGPGSFTGGQLMSINTTLTADISIKNPNQASFRFDNSTTEFYYKEQTVGVAYAPDGRVGAHRTARMNVTVDVMTDQVAFGTNATSSALAGAELNLMSFTDLTGRVSLLVYKRDVEIQLNCSMTIVFNDVQTGVIKNKICMATVL